MTSFVESIQPCLTSNCQHWTVGEVLIGIDKGWVYWAPAAILLIYNLCRATLTWMVGPLKEEEERSGYSPPFRAPASDVRVWKIFRSFRKPILGMLVRVNGYGWLLWPHRAMQALIWFALLSILYHFYHWLSASIWLPQ
jgi:hypothetical protein